MYEIQGIDLRYQLKTLAQGVASRFFIPTQSAKIYSRLWQNYVHCMSFFVGVTVMLCDNDDAIQK